MPKKTPSKGAASEDSDASLYSATDDSAMSGSDSDGAHGGHEPSSRGRAGKKPKAAAAGDGVQRGDAAEPGPGTNFVSLLDRASSIVQSKIDAKKRDVKKNAVGRVAEAEGAGNAKKKKSSVVYLGHIPHGFYEDQMRGFFSQFGKVSESSHTVARSHTSRSPCPFRCLC